MRYCEKCGLVIDEFSYWREKQNCPICSGVWSEDDMTALKYAELSEVEKDAYDKQLLNIIKNSSSFDEHSFNLNGNSTKNGEFWSDFRTDKWRQLDSSVPIEQIDETIEDRKNREPFKPFPPIDTVKAREVALDAEIMHKKIDDGYFSKSVAEQVNVPKCPTCGSTDIEKISMTKKVFGGAMFGLFSSDIRNTMHCRNCGVKW